MATAWPISEDAPLIADSIAIGDMFLPAELIRSSFLRSMIRR